MNRWPQTGDWAPPTPQHPSPVLPALAVVLAAALFVCVVRWRGDR